MSGFRRTRAGVELTLSAEESTLLRQVLAEMIALLDEPSSPRPDVDPLEQMLGEPSRERPRPDDPALARLLPDAYADAEAAAEYRRLTEGELRARKVSALRDALATLPPAGAARTVLGDEAAEAWLAALNDARLTLGVRYDVDEGVAERLAALPPQDPAVPGLSVYLWLGWLQEMLVEAVAGW